MEASALNAGTFACIEEPCDYDGENSEGDEEIKGRNYAALCCVGKTKEFWDKECTIGCNRCGKARDERSMNGTVKDEGDHAEGSRIDKTC